MGVFNYNKPTLNVIPVQFGGIHIKKHVYFGGVNHVQFGGQTYSFFPISFLPITAVLFFLQKIRFD
jgi:hypothetical protein